MPGTNNGPNPNKRPDAGDMPKKKDPLKGAAEPLDIFGEQELTEEEEDLKREAYSRLDLWGPDCQEYHTEAKECRLIYRLKDPHQDPPGTRSDQKMLQLQTLKSTLNNCIADQVDNTPEAYLVPQRDDLSDVAVDMNNVVKYIMQINHVKEFHRRRAQDFLITGTAVTQVMWDPDMDFGKGNISVSRFPIESMVWDPVATDVQAARAIMKLSWHPLSWYTEHFPDQAKFIRDDTTEHNAIGLDQDLSNLSIDQDEGKALLLEYWYRRYDKKKNAYSINVAYLAGGALLEVYKDVYAHGMYPFVFDVYTEIEGQMVGEGQVHELANMMRYINRYAHYMDVNIAASAKMRMLARRGSGINLEQLADFSRNIIEGDVIDEENVRWLESKPFNGMTTNQMLQYQNDMKMDSGQSQFTRGEVTGGVDAASAIQLLQNAGSKITRLRTQSLADGFAKIVEQILWLAAEYYKEDRVAMISNELGMVMPVHLSSEYLMKPQKKQSRLEPPPYTVQIEINRKNPAAVQAQNDLFIQAYTMAAEGGQVFPLTALFQLLQVDGKERIIPVLREVEATTQQMQQLAAENEQLKAQTESMQQTLDGYANIISSNPGSQDALTAMGGNADQAALSTI